jgi:hypothetical protein
VEVEAGEDAVEAEAGEDAVEVEAGEDQVEVEVSRWTTTRSRPARTRWR